MEVKTEPNEEMFTSVIDIVEHPIKLEPDDVKPDYFLWGQQDVAQISGGGGEISEISNEFELKQHELSSKKFFCAHCKTVGFSNKLQILNHIKTKHLRKGKIKFICKHCKFEFVKKENLILHIKNVHEKKIPMKLRKNARNRTFYQCTMCRFESNNKLNVETHYRHKHSKEQPYICEICDKGFFGPNGLRSHMPTHKEPKFQCKLCGKKFKWQNTLKEHIHYVHTKNTRRWQCDKCPSKFKSKSNLNAHKERMHTNMKYKCKICNIPIKTAHYLRVHLRLKHSSVKKFECKMCQRSFSLLWVLNKHNKAQHPAENRETEPCFECEKCGAVFIKKITLARHFEDLHLYNRSNIFHCQFCSRQFRNPMRVKLHIKRKHGIEKIP